MFVIADHSLRHLAIETVSSFTKMLWFILLQLGVVLTLRWFEPNRGQNQVKTFRF
jgi:hypothetical protein